MGHLAIRETLVGDSVSMQQVLALAEDAAQTDTPLLIEGEAGSGRELLARAIHYASARRDGVFVTFKAAATPSELIDGELVGDRGGRAGGHLRRAVGGTLLVKDIVEVPRGPQKKLARVVRRGRRGREDTLVGEALDVRLMAATDLDPDTAVENGLLDKEFYERLGARRIEVPPLRKRIEDIPRLAWTFTLHFSAGARRGRCELSTPAIDRLVRYPWPGNVSQLKDVVRRVLLRTRHTTIEAVDFDGILPELGDRVPLEDLPFEEMVRSKLRAWFARNRNTSIRGLHDAVLQKVERPLIELVLEQTEGNQVRAAEMLDINRNTLRKRIAELGIAPKKPSKER